MIGSWEIGRSPRPAAGSCGFLPLLAVAAVLTMPVHLIAAPSPPPVQFVDVAGTAGIDFVYVSGGIGEKYMPEGMGSGAAFFDYDGDGWLDLFIVNGAPLPGYPVGSPPSDALYRNLGNGTFVETTRAVGVADTAYGMGAAVGDYDNDGDRDLYVTNVGPNVLYRNQGDGTFSDVTKAAGVGDRGWGTNAAFVDYDADGDLDLYVANYLQFDLAGHQRCFQGSVRAYCAPTAYRGQSGVLYRNEANGTFSDVTRAAGLQTEAGRQLGAVFGDYDDDGDQDLFIANDKTPNFLFRNEGDGTFTDEGLMAGVAYSESGEAESAMGADLGDYDNDGRLDIIIATYQWAPNSLYHNDGNGTFTDVTYPARLGAESLPYLGMTAAFIDYDNDGFQDIFLANGHIDDNVKEFDPAASYAQRNQLFRNRGDGTFSEVSATAGPGFQVAKVSHGAAFGDYDNDGDTDVFVSDSDDQPSQLLCNDGGNANHYLTIQVRGTRSNRDGIGARLEVSAADLTQMKEVRSGYGYLGASDHRVIFGLGHRLRADRVQVRWPSGTIDLLRNVPVDRIITVVEGEHPLAPADGDRP